jgi:hypothetical protein
MSLDYEITPDPEPEEAAALIAALEQAIAEDGAFALPPVEASAWRRAGIREAFE